MKALRFTSKKIPKKDYKLSDLEKKRGMVLVGSSVYKNPKIDIVEVPKPKIGARDVLIEVRSCGICGTDLHLVEHDDEGYILYPGPGRFDNLTLGHELSGVIVEIGKEVEGFNLGDFVTAEEMTWCGECIACKNGFPNQCERLEEIGITYDGGMAEYIRVPARLCWSLNSLKNIYKDEDILFDVGATVEPNSVAYNAIFERGSGIKPGHRVVVFGCGPIGLFGISQLKAAGASKLIVVEPEERRRNLAIQMGADLDLNPNKIVDSNKRIEDILLEESDGQGIDFFLESSGATADTMPIMLNTLNVNAKIVLVAWPSYPVPTDFKKMFPRSSQIFCSMGHSGNGTFENVIRLISSKMIQPEKVISARYALKDGLEAFKQAQKRLEAKIIIKPQW